MSAAASIHSSSVQAYHNVLNELIPIAQRQDESLKIHVLSLNGDVEGLTAWLADPVQAEKRVNVEATAMKLYPLHICAMLGHTECARILTSVAACNINPQDVSGATPMIHAAAGGHNAMLELLKSKKPKLLLDNRGGGFQHVLRQMILPKPESVNFLYKNDKGEIAQGDGTMFKHLVGADLLEREHFISTEEWLKIWRANNRGSDLQPLSLDQKYEDYCQNPPKIYLEKHQLVGWNVCAGQDILPGMVIGEYIGEIIEGSGVAKTLKERFSKEKNKEFVMGNIDAIRFRNMIPMINDSFPNASMLSLKNKKGMTQRDVLVAIDKIKAGDSITFSYGLGHDIRMQKRCELRLDAMLKYFRTHCTKDGTFWNLTANAFNERDRLLRVGVLPEPASLLDFQAIIYIFSTPAALLFLLCERAIPWKDVVNILSDANLVNFITGTLNKQIFRFSTLKLECFYKVICDFFPKLAQQTHEDQEKKLTELKAATDTHNTDQLMQLLTEKGDLEKMLQALILSAVSASKKM